MTEDAAHDMHRNVVLEHDRAGACRRSWNLTAGRPLRWRKRPELARHVRRIEWRADLRREDQVRLLPDGEDAELFLALPALVLQECLNDRRRQAEGSPGLRGLGLDCGAQFAAHTLASVEHGALAVLAAGVSPAHGQR